ncbi:hypothetical protein C0585_05435, partial [Candidatus Woesearchaeota archaeon]
MRIRNLFLVILMIIMAASVLGVDINNCTSTVVINNPGTYDVTDNLTTTTTCIDIQSDDVTLDCQGKTLTGDGWDGHDHGINLDDLNNITLSDCNINNFEVGVYLNKVNESNIINVNSSNNKWGYYLFTSYHNAFNTINSFDNFTGFSFLLNSNNNSFTNIYSVNINYSLSFTNSYSNIFNESFFRSDLSQDIYFTNSNSNIFYLNNLTNNSNFLIFSSVNSFNYSVGGFNLGNYWNDLNCLETTDRNGYNVCVDPSSYTIDIGNNIYDYAPLNEVAIGPNNPPVLNSVGDRSVDEGSPLVFTISATDADLDSLTYSATNLPTGADFTGQIFNWTPFYNQAGTYDVTFNVTDGEDQDSETITITVNEFAIYTILNVSYEGNQAINQTITFYANYTGFWGSIIENSTCLINFSDSPSTFINMNFSGNYYYEREFSSIGTYDYTVSCNKTDYQTKTVTDSIQIYNDTSYVVWENFKNYITTNFTNISDIENVVNPVIAIPSLFRIAWNHTLNLSGYDLDNNILFSDDYVYIDDADLPELNSSAVITLYGLDYEYEPIIFRDADLDFNSGYAVYNPGFKEYDSNNGVLNFSVDGFSAYFTSGNSQLEISDSGITPANQTINLFANYTNFTNLEFIAGASCYINFSDSPSTYDLMVEDTNIYNYSKIFSIQGIYTYTVNCSVTGFETIILSDVLNITDAIITDIYSDPSFEPYVEYFQLNTSNSSIINILGYLGNMNLSVANVTATLYSYGDPLDPDFITAQTSWNITSTDANITEYVYGNSTVLVLPTSETQNYTYKIDVPYDSLFENLTERYIYFDDHPRFDQQGYKILSSEVVLGSPPYVIPTYYRLLLDKERPEGIAIDDTFYITDLARRANYFNKTLTLNYNGTNYIGVYVTNGYEEVYSSTRAEVFLDQKPPRINITTFSEYYYIDSPIIDFDVYDDYGINTSKIYAIADNGTINETFSINTSLVSADSNITCAGTSSSQSCTLTPQNLVAGTYNLTIDLSDTLGNSASETLEFTIFASFNAVAGIIDEGITTTNNTLNFWWTPSTHPAFSYYEYAIGKDNIDCYCNEWNDTFVGNTSSNFTTYTGNLVFGRNYFINIREVYVDGSKGPWAYSDGIRFMDETPPVPLSVEVSGSSSILSQSYTKSDIFTITFNFSEEESSISSYMYEIGEETCGKDNSDSIQGKSLVTGNPFTTVNLSLEYGKTYYVNAWASNNQGYVTNATWSTCISSSPITFDNRSPTGGWLEYDSLIEVGNITYVNSVDLRYYTGTDEFLPLMNVTLKESKSALSIIDGTCSLSSGYNTVRTLIRDNNTEDVITQSIESGYCYRYKIEICDQAGNCIEYPDVQNIISLRVDSTPPNPPTILRDEGAEIYSTSIYFNWSGASDPESGIGYYQYRIRENSTTGPIIYGWEDLPKSPQYELVTNLPLEHNEWYYIEMRSYNNLGFPSVDSKFSNGIQFVDKVSPILPEILAAGNTTSNTSEKPEYYFDYVDSNYTNITIKTFESNVNCIYSQSDEGYNQDLNPLDNEGYCDVSLGNNTFICQVPTSYGENDYYISCVDDAGNPQTNNQPLTIIKDYLPPSITLGFNNESTSNEDYDLIRLPNGDYKFRFNESNDLAIFTFNVTLYDYLYYNYSIDFLLDEIIYANINDSSSELNETIEVLLDVDYFLLGDIKTNVSINASTEDTSGLTDNSFTTIIYDPTMPIATMEELDIVINTPLNINLSAYDTTRIVVNITRKDNETINGSYNYYAYEIVYNESGDFENTTIIDWNSLNWSEGEYYINITYYNDFYNLTGNIEDQGRIDREIILDNGNPIIYLPEYYHEKDNYLTINTPTTYNGESIELKGFSQMTYFAKEGDVFNFYGNEIILQAIGNGVISLFVNSENSNMLENEKELIDNLEVYVDNVNYVSDDNKDYAIITVSYDLDAELEVEIEFNGTAKNVTLGSYRNFSGTFIYFIKDYIVPGFDNFTKALVHVSNETIEYPNNYVVPSSDHYWSIAWDKPRFNTQIIGFDFMTFDYSDLNLSYKVVETSNPSIIHKSGIPTLIDDSGFNKTYSINYIVPSTFKNKNLTLIVNSVDEFGNTDSSSIYFAIYIKTLNLTSFELDDFSTGTFDINISSVNSNILAYSMNEELVNFTQTSNNLSTLTQKMDEALTRSDSIIDVTALALNEYYEYSYLTSQITVDNADPVIQYIRELLGDELLLDLNELYIYEGMDIELTDINSDNATIRVNLSSIEYDLDESGFYPLETEFNITLKEIYYNPVAPEHSKAIIQVFNATDEPMDYPYLINEKILPDREEFSYVLSGSTLYYDGNEILIDEFSYYYDELDVFCNGEYNELMFDDWESLDCGTHNYDIYFESEYANIDGVYQEYLNITIDVLGMTYFLETNDSINIYGLDIKLKEVNLDFVILEIDNENHLVIFDSDPLGPFKKIGDELEIKLASLFYTGEPDDSATLTVKYVGNNTKYLIDENLTVYRDWFSVSNGFTMIDVSLNRSYFEFTNSSGGVVENGTVPSLSPVTHTISISKDFDANYTQLNLTVFAYDSLDKPSNITIPLIYIAGDMQVNEILTTELINDYLQNTINFSVYFENVWYANATLINSTGDKFLIGQRNISIYENNINWSEEFDISSYGDGEYILRVSYENLFDEKDYFEKVFIKDTIAPNITLIEAPDIVYNDGITFTFLVNDTNPLFNRTFFRYDNITGNFSNRVAYSLVTIPNTEYTFTLGHHEPVNGSYNYTIAFTDVAGNEGTLELHYPIINRRPFFATEEFLMESKNYFDEIDSSLFYSNERLVVPIIEVFDNSTFIEVGSKIMLYDDLDEFEKEIDLGYFNNSNNTEILNISLADHIFYRTTDLLVYYEEMIFLNATTTDNIDTLYADYNVVYYDILSDGINRVNVTDLYYLDNYEESIIFYYDNISTDLYDYYLINQSGSYYLFSNETEFDNFKIVDGLFDFIEYTYEDLIFSYKYNLSSNNISSSILLNSTDWDNYVIKAVVAEQTNTLYYLTSDDKLTILNLTNNNSITIDWDENGFYLSDDEEMLRYFDYVYILEEYQGFETGSYFDIYAYPYSYDLIDRDDYNRLDIIKYKIYPDFIEPINDISLSLGENITLNLDDHYIEFDSNDGNLTYVSGDDISIIIDDSLYTIVPDTDFIGKSWIQFQITDTLGKTDFSDNITIEVINGSRHNISSIAPLHYNYYNQSEFVNESISLYKAVYDEESVLLPYNLNFSLEIIPDNDEEYEFGIRNFTASDLTYLD